MSATLRLAHKAIGVEVRRGTYDAVVDDERVGSVEMNDTIEIPIEAGCRTLQVRIAGAVRAFCSPSPGPASSRARQNVDSVARVDAAT